MTTRNASPIPLLRRLIDNRIRALLRGIVPASLRSPIAGLLGGGKRVRALITLLACEAAGGRAVRALDAAAGIELLHAASLIHDDIMDRATLRRGRPALHAVCGTNQAIVCGDYLVALAYEQVFRAGKSARAAALENVNRGYRRLCEGQLLEERANANGRAPSRKVLIEIMEKKTASLIESAAVLGVLCGRGGHAAPKTLGSWARFGRFLGIAFQIQDDILDRAGDERETGKNRLLDRRNKKMTYVGSGGLRAMRSARTDAERYIGKALVSLRRLAPSPARRHLEDFVKSMSGRRV